MNDNSTAPAHDGGEGRALPSRPAGESLTRAGKAGRGPALRNEVQPWPEASMLGALLSTSPQGLLIPF